MDEFFEKKKIELLFIPFKSMSHLCESSVGFMMNMTKMDLNTIGVQSKPKNSKNLNIFENMLMKKASQK